MTREPSALWSWLKLMLSLRAALYNLMGNDTSPKVRCPFQTVDAMASYPIRKHSWLFCVGQDANLRPIANRPSVSIEIPMAARKLRRKAPLRPHPGASSGPAGTRHKAALQFCVQRHHATHLHYDLRLEVGRSAEILGRSERPDPRPGGEAAGHDGGGSSSRIRQFRRRHSQGQLRRGQRHAVGSRNVSATRGSAGGTAACQGRFQVSPDGRETARRFRAGTHQAGQG